MLKFDIKLKAADLYRFYMYYMFTSLRGLLAPLLGVALLAYVLFSGKFTEGSSGIFYGIVAALMIVYSPIVLWFRARRLVSGENELAGTMHFCFTDEEGVHVKIDGIDFDTVLTWGDVYKAVMTKHNLLIFSGLRTAYIFPRDQITEEQLDEICRILRAHCLDFRLHLKGR